MNSSTTLYRFGAWWKHQLCAWNTGGEGIHSPYLFHLVRMIISDDNRYYCWSAIEERRQAMLHAPKRIEVTDYGSKGQGATYSCLVSDVARNSLESARNAQVFFRIVNWLSHEAGKPLEIIELGTNLGITTAYLASVSASNHVTTYEGSESLVELAQLNWKKLGLKNIEVVQGNIDETLLIHSRKSKVESKKTFDVAFVDANHRFEPTCRYIDFLAARVHEKSMIIIDDIHHSKDMERAWKWIQERKDVTSTMDFFDFGLVFFDSHYLKKHYRLRI